MTFIREAAMAGQFYPCAAAELDATVRNFLDAADTGHDPVPKAIIAPHAGYIFRRYRRQRLRTINSGGINH